MELKALPVVSGNYNLTNYEDTYRQFDWKEAEKNFSWYECNLAIFINEIYFS